MEGTWSKKSKRPKLTVRQISLDKDGLGDESACVEENLCFQTEIFHYEMLREATKSP